MENILEEITPADSVAPVFLELLSAEKLAELEAEDAKNESKAQDALNAAVAKESATAKLAALGLTEEEITALIGA